MTQEYFTVLTRAGEAKLTTLAVTGQALKLTEFAVGDGGGSGYAPTSDELRGITTLVHEVYRGPIALLDQDAQYPAQYYMEGLIPVEAGPFTVREAGWYDSDGVMIFATRYPPVEKTTLAQGAQVELPLGTYVSTHQVSEGRIEILVDPSKILATRQYVDGRFEFIPIIANITVSSPRNYRFMAHAIAMLPSSGGSIRFIVDHSVDLTSGNCVIQAPAGETIVAPRGSDNQVRIMLHGREFVFVRINNQWRVS